MPDQPLDTATMPQTYEDDPILIRCRREAFMILGMWLCCFLWTTTYCYLNGYLSHEPQPETKALGPDIARIVGPLESFNRDPKTVTYPLGLGVPDWVFWGLVVPWGIAIVASLAFCVFVFAEDELGHAAEAE